MEKTTTQSNPQPKIETPYIAQPAVEHKTIKELLNILVEELTMNRTIKKKEYYDSIIRDANYYLNEDNNE